MARSLVEAKVLCPPGFLDVNFMTPNVEYYVKLREGLGHAELSTGTGMSGNALYGVTVRRHDGTDPNKLSKPFRTKEDAEAYIKGLL